MIGFNPLTSEITIKVKDDLTVSDLSDICQMIKMQLEEVHSEANKIDNKDEILAES